MGSTRFTCGRFSPLMRVIWAAFRLFLLNTLLFRASFRLHPKWCPITCGSCPTAFNVGFVQIMDVKKCMSMYISRGCPTAFSLVFTFSIDWYRSTSYSYSISNPVGSNWTNLNACRNDFCPCLYLMVVGC